MRLLEADSGLGLQLTPAERQSAAPALVVVAEILEPGVWDPSASGIEPRDGDLGALVVEGLLLRDVRVARSTVAELIGKGDVLRPWTHVGIGAPVPSQVEWTVLERATVAYLDQRFLEAAAPWPGVVGAVVQRTVDRAQSIAVALAISCMGGLHSRLLALLWTLADRFGRVGPDGVHVDLPLTHQVLARLAGASRPSVSSVLKELEREGHVARTPARGYVLYGDPPGELVGDAPDAVEAL